MALVPCDECGTDEVSRCLQITWEDLKAAEMAVGEFGGDNRAGVEGTLHRISALRNRKGTVVGLTCRVGRAVTGHVDMIRDMIEGENLASLGTHPAAIYTPVPIYLYVRNSCCENPRPCPRVHHMLHAVYVRSSSFCCDTLSLSIVGVGEKEYTHIHGVRRIH